MSAYKQTRSLGPLLLGAVHFLIGAALLIGGAILAARGGSWYYLVAGAGLLASGYLLARRRLAGAGVYAVVFLATVVWAFYESGLDYWRWVPRIGVPLLLAILTALVVPTLVGFSGRRRYAWGGAALLSAVFGVGFALAFVPHGVIAPTVPIANRDQGNEKTAQQGQTSTQWAYYGGDAAATRYAALSQINKSNVDTLEVAWTAHTGEVATAGLEDQNTPLQIGDTLYVCTPRSKVIALDADTGDERWSFDPQSDTGVWQRCRSLAYYEATSTAASETQPQTPALPAVDDASANACIRRIFVATNDARLIALDANTGSPCADFGNAGSVDLTQGLGTKPEPGIYSQTSSPLVADGLVILGGRIYDNIATNLPSGVVRAFDARTGELAWAWDLGNPAIDKQPPDGETYTPGTPNVWITPSYDEDLGLVYLPTGNTTPDFWGGQRTPAEDAYTAAIVALDVRTGKERWKFQTTHHDLWDYDVPAQPLLYDIPNAQGGKTSALVQVTKRGQIFLLDRRDGTPLAEVEERPVPSGGVPDDRLSPTQPFSVGMPSVGDELLSERRMWGLSMFDQLICRIQFKGARYEGYFTPPNTDVALMWPGFYGGMNWGGAAVNATNDYLIVNDIRLAQMTQLFPREETDRIIASGSGGGGAGHDGINAQSGTPYGVLLTNFMSPLGVPCQEPPFGSMTAIDLKTQQVVWQRPLGTTEDTGPLGIKTGLSVPIGTPTLSGSLTTQSGIVFYAGTSDYYLRAIDVETGRELWKGRLPVGGQAAPMTYVSPKTGKQYVVINAGGARNSPDRSDLVIAYALP